MVCSNVPNIYGRVPVDRSRPKLRQAHDAFESGNLIACGACLKESLRLHFIALCEFHGLKPRRPGKPGSLLQQLVEVKAIGGCAAEWLGEIIGFCNKLLRCETVGTGSLEFALSFAYEVIDGSAHNQIARGSL